MSSITDLMKINAGVSQQTEAIKDVKETRTGNFSDSLGNMIKQVDALQKKSGEEIKDFIAGKQGNIHEVMASAQEAQLSFQLMLEIRNKLLESYHELMRMQV